MSAKLSKNQLEKYSRQIILKNIGIVGQNKILKSKVLIVGMGGLGCPVAEFLTRSGIGSIGIIDHDLVSLSNIHRQTLYDEKDLGKFKVKIAKKKLNNINSKTKIDTYNFKLDRKKFIKIVKNYDYQTKQCVNNFIHQLQIHFFLLLNFTFRKFKFNKSRIKIYPFKSFPTFKIFFKISLACMVPIIPAIVPTTPSYSQFKMSSGIVSS